MTLIKDARFAMADTLGKILNHLTQIDLLYKQREGAGLADTIVELQKWQCQRLIASHLDFWGSDRFRPAMQFFVDELYGPSDFRQRDQDIAMIVPKMAKVLPGKALHSLEQAMHLNALSMELDLDMAKALDGRTVNKDHYAAAYRDCNNRDARQQQISLIEELGDALAQVTKIRGIGTLLAISRKPAQVAGILSLHEFLERGFKAFKKLGKVEDFIIPIIVEEQRLMKALFAGENPLPEVSP